MQEDKQGNEAQRPRLVASESAQPPEGRDVLNENYRTILGELTLLTTVSVLLFGFLLTNARQARSGLEEWLYTTAMVLVASATLVFVLPAVYHHIEFPYSDLEKFKTRTHFWIVVGSPLLTVGLYLSLCVAIWHLLNAWSFGIAALPLIAVVVVFVLRKGKF